jgi:seryl-tRNA synthetase
MTGTSPGTPDYVPPNDVEKLREAVARDMALVMDLLDDKRRLKEQIAKLEEEVVEAQAQVDYAQRIRNPNATGVRCAELEDKLNAEMSWNKELAKVNKDVIAKVDLWRPTVLAALGLYQSLAAGHEELRIKFMSKLLDSAKALNDVEQGGAHA